VRIEGFRRETRGDRRRVAADVVWEDADRPSRTVWFETTARFGGDLSPQPHAFLLAAAIPALRAREARVRVDGGLCPRLRDGLTQAMELLCAWHAPRRRVPRIEAADARDVARGEGRRALFLSGGVDSLALLRGAMGRPDGFRDAFCVEGFDIYAGPGEPRTDLFERTLASLAPVAREADITLIPVRTNLRDLDTGWAWLYEWLAAGTASVAHAFAGRIGRVAIAASAHEADAVPQGTHPRLDPLYSSAALAVSHAGAHERRIDKVERVAGWASALRVLRVCYQMDELRLVRGVNCGRCHKCVLTMLELVAAGRLADCPTFTADDVDPRMTNALRPTTASSAGYYRELVAPLRARGRDDLADAVAHKLAVHSEFERRRRARPWWSRLRRGYRRRLDAWAERQAEVDAAGAPVRR
jgi:hypothetical protein